MQTLKSFGQILSLQTLIVAVLAVLATHLCLRFELTADFPLTLIGTAIIFPIVFSIGGAYKRREAALDSYGSIKAHGRAIFLASRDWVPDTDTELQATVRDQLGVLLGNCRELFAMPVDQMAEAEERVYQSFSDLSILIRGFRARGLPSGEASRCNQYLSKTFLAFERVKHIYQYRTPRTLKAYSRVFLHLLPILYGPYFAEISREFASGLTYVMPVFFSVVFVSLENIQEHLENPFDQVGEDDILIRAEKFVERLDTQAWPAPEAG